MEGDDASETADSELTGRREGCRGAAQRGSLQIAGRAWEFRFTLLEGATNGLRRRLGVTPSGLGEITVSDEGMPMQPDHIIKKVVWRGVVAIGSTLEKATTWSIAGVAAITGLLVSNLHSLAAMVAIGRLRTVVILFTMSLVTGAISKVIGMAVTAGLRAVRDLEEVLSTEEHRRLMGQMTIAPRQLTRDLAEPFLWPLAVLMRRSGERGVTDYLSADKKFVRLFCIQLYLNALHGLFALSALLTLALPM